MTEKKIIATVNNEEIVQEDLDNLVQMMGQQAMQFQSEEGQNRLKDELVHQRLLYLDAMENHLDEEQEYKEEFERMKRQFAQQYALHKLINSIELKDEDLKEYYEAHKDKFKEVYQFDADHILVAEEEEAKEVKKQLDEGADFAELAKEKSTCPSSENGGNLGKFSSGQMIPEFEQALIGLEKDEISEPVHSQFGYHVIKLNEKNLEKSTEFDAVKGEIEQQMRILKQQEVYANKMKELEKKYTVTRNYGDAE